MNTPELALDSCAQYTVGWVAPLPIERAAVEALLDEKHAAPRDFSQPPTDKLSYSWGSLSRHNVVIASLKSGVYGTNSAATVATSMLSSFPEIRFGLLVGIGGGIPQPDEGYDIRLGDIVVSQPSGSSGGVIQYGLVKATKGGQRERKDFLNSPPEVLLYALSKLQSQHEQRPSFIPDYLKDMEARNPFMFKSRPNNPGYKHQGSQNDRLFKASYEHSTGRECRNCAKEEEFEREERESTDPEIFYGVIASGNTLVKDAAAREQLLEHLQGENCICYEMEAAGLMNSFPCIVVRGVCDYADSHKNDRWQRYAAATAAAFAKELLECTPPEEVVRTRKAAEIMEHKQVNAAVKNTSETHRLVQDDKVKEWLSPPNPSSNFNRANEQWHTETGSWFLQGDNFADWKVQCPAFLWIHGIPGCGKTVLSSAIVRNLHEQNSLGSKGFVIYFYFDFNDARKQSFDGMVRSFIHQLSHSTEDLESKSNPEVLKLFNSCAKGTQQPTIDQLVTSMHSLIQKFDDVKIVLDALDEAPKTDRDKIVSWIRKSTRSTPSNVHILVTSRLEHDIEAELADLHRGLGMSRKAVDEDIEKYVCSKVQTHPGLKRWRNHAAVLNEIEKTLIEKAGGMFRWVSCQLDMLEDCLNLEMLRQALKSLPITLNETYARIWNKIPKIQQQYARRLLQLLVFTTRPLRISEAVDAIAIDTSKTPAFKEDERMPEPTEIVRLCSSLVEKVKISKSAPNSDSIELHLAHFSVKEYLLSGSIKDCAHSFANLQAHGSITQISIAYLRSVQSSVDPGNVFSRFPFVDYITWNLFHHARLSQEHAQTNQAIVGFLLDSSTYPVWSSLFKPGKRAGYFKDADEGEFHPSVGNIPGTLGRYCAIPDAIFLAASQRLHCSVRALMEQNVNPPANAEDSDVVEGSVAHFREAFYVNPDGSRARKRPLYFASEKGYTDVVKVLLDHGVDMAQRGGPEGSALNGACSAGQREVVYELLRKNTNTRNEDKSPYDNALEIASRLEDTTILHRLLEKGAKVPKNAAYRAFKDRNQLSLFTILQLEPAHGTESMCSELIRILESTYHHFWRGGRLELEIVDEMKVRVVRKLRELDVEGSLLKRAFGVALESGATRTVHALFTAGLPPIIAGKLLISQMRDRWSWPIIKWPPKQEDSSDHSIVQALATRDSEHGMTPLHWAVSTRALSLARDFLLYGADTECKDNSGKMPLDHAHEEDVSIVASLFRRAPYMHPGEQDGELDSGLESECFPSPWVSDEDDEWGSGPWDIESNSE